MGDDKAAVEHPSVDFVEQQLREPHRREVFEWQGSTYAQQHRDLFRADAVPAWPPPFNWLTTSSYPLSRCQIGSHQTGGELRPSGGCHQGSTCT
jgi:hypothetical protein